MDIIIILMMIGLVGISGGLLLPALFSTTLIPFWLIILVTCFYIGILLILIIKVIPKRLKRIIRKLDKLLGLNK